MRLLPLLALPLLAQSQSTFYAAYEDGLEMERQGDWRGALGAYRRAAVLHPSSAAQALTYGNNLLKRYYPYTRMARCHLELKELEAAEAQLARAQHEPAREREELAQRLRDLKAARAAMETPRVPPAPPENPVLNPVLTRPAEPAAPLPEPPAAQVDARSAPAQQEARPAPRPAPLSKPAFTQTPATAPVPPSALTPASLSVWTAPSRPAWPWLLLLLPPSAAFFWRRRSASRPVGEFSEPERIGPYRVERLLGRGGFASTYLARHEATGQRVALKRPHPHRLEDAEFVSRFHQEARLGSRLNHPNLVRLVDPGPPQGPPWLAMDYIEGQRLDEHLKARGPLPLAEGISIARGIAAGLAYAHGEGIVHRDLKPANIMLARAGVKIMDFGIARLLDVETLTTSYAFLGTPRYAAPETQIMTAIGPAADWYSFGIVLFEMFAGQTPFQGGTPFEILDRHRSQPLPDPRSLRPDVPGSLAALIAELCAKAPEARPGDEEILRRLNGLAL